MKNQREVSYEELFDAMFYENERDVKLAELQIMWYTKEISEMKHNSKEKAKEALDIWTQRKNGLIKRKQQLFEWEKLYNEKQ